MAEVDGVTDEVWLQITGSKAVRLSAADVTRLRRQLGQARQAIGGEPGDEPESA